MERRKKFGIDDRLDCGVSRAHIPATSPAVLESLARPA